MKQFSAVEFALRFEIAYLPGRMDSGIGSSASDQFDGVAHSPLNYFFQRFLNRALAKLSLPSMELGPVISDGHVDVSMHAAIVPFDAIRWK